MERLLVCTIALVLAVPVGVAGIPALSLGREGLAVPHDAPVEALALAAQARGFPGAVEVRLDELGPDARDLRAAVGTFYATVLGIPLPAGELDTAMAQLGALSPGWRAGLAEALAAMSAAQRLRTQAFEGVAWAEIGFAERVALQAQFAPDAVDPTDALRALAVLARIDSGSMLHGAALLQAAMADAKFRFAGDAAPTERIDTAYDALTLGTMAAETYDVDKQLLIDPGGDDVYLNNQGGVLNQQMFDTTGGCVFGGGTTGLASPNLGCTPLPSQVCTYDILNNAAGTGLFPAIGLPNHDPPGSGNGHDGSCGSDARRAALFAHTAGITTDGDSRMVAALLDLGGSDTYALPWTHEDKLFGLVEFCFPGEEDKVNTNRDLFQGGNLAGISLLWDDGPGDNTFRGRLNAQGSGHVGGVGITLSTGGGDDFYWADRLSQGNGIAAGVGVLVDAGGTNTYLLDPPIVYRNEFRPNGRDCAQEGRAGQGEGGFVGVGVLWNEGERAVYRAVVHETEAEHPFAPVLGIGGPLLAHGTDAQGSGESFPIVNTPGGLVIGVGVLVDHTDGANTICGGAGMVTGSNYVTQSAGTIDAACGKFNVSPEVDPDGDLEAAFQRLLSGAYGFRVVV
ncbi:MAG TPA: hypothetical protein VGR28_11135 [Candidatus Thermoplasmatota archaeon]|jgi:hypothetical protein|nr:hypothetical protein [Candidatus Thermoplasmatota archaeon]